MQNRTGNAIRRFTTHLGDFSRVFTHTHTQMSLDELTASVAARAISLRHDVYALRVGEPGKLTLPDERRRFLLDTSAEAMEHTAVTTSANGWPAMADENLVSQADKHGAHVVMTASTARLLLCMERPLVDERQWTIPFRVDLMIQRGRGVNRVRLYNALPPVRLTEMRCLYNVVRTVASHQLIVSARRAREANRRRQALAAAAANTASSRKKMKLSSTGEEEHTTAASVAEEDDNVSPTGDDSKPAASLRIDDSDEDDDDEKAQTALCIDTDDDNVEAPKPSAESGKEEPTPSIEQSPTFNLGSLLKSCQENMTKAAATSSTVPQPLTFDEVQGVQFSTCIRLHKVTAVWRLFAHLK